MKHLHFKEISSSQEYLKDNKDLLQTDCLISCDVQTNGIGQYGREWDSYQETLCFSCRLTPNAVPTLTSLEVSCLIQKYFSFHHNLDLKVKWPNDILTKDCKKVGGVLLNNIGGQMAVGVGLNILKTEESKNYQTPYGYIFDYEFSFDKKQMSKNIYEFILTNRLDPEIVLKTWTDICIHLNKSVRLIDGENLYQGVFLGLGENGEALIQIKDSSIKPFYSGTIRI